MVCEQLKDVATELKLLTPVFEEHQMPKPKGKNRRDGIKESSLLTEREWSFQVKVSTMLH